MKAYHNDETIKTKYMTRVREHRAADELIKGATQGRHSNGTFKGCAVVCTLERYDHAGYETELGIPRKLARLEDGIFETLPDDRAMSWPEEFLAAIPVGADLSLVADKFLHWLLVDPHDGVINFAKTEAVKTAIKTVGDLYAKKIGGEDVPIEAWQTALAAAAAAAYAAAAAAAYADAAAAADAYADAAAAAYADAAAAAAAYAAAYAYAYAAYAYAAYAYAAYAYAARKKARVKQADKLLELLKAAK